jgi:hypothetical protein
VIDEKTLRPLKKRVAIVPDYPARLNQVQSDFKGMGIRRAVDVGDSGSESVRYILQWETLGTNRDHPRKPPLPEPGMLRLHKLVARE